MAPKKPSAALMPGSAVHAELAPASSGANPFVRTVVDHPTSVAGKSLQAVTVHYSAEAKGTAHEHARSNPSARHGYGLCYEKPRLARCARTLACADPRRQVGRSFELRVWQSAATVRHWQMRPGRAIAPSHLLAPIPVPPLAVRWL
jgi:hypothetical protein